MSSRPPPPKLTEPLVLEFEEIPPSLNGKSGLLRMHWTKRGQVQQSWANSVQLLIAQIPEFEPLTSCLILYTVSGVRWRDYDNLAASFKLLGDALVNAKVMVDDSSAIVKLFFPIYRHVGHWNEESARVEIIPCSPEREYMKEMEAWIRKNFVVAGMANTDTG